MNKKTAKGLPGTFICPNAEHMMRYLYLNILFAFMLLLTALSYPCLGAGLEEVVGGLQRRYDSISSVEADFTQEFSSKSMKEPQVSEGRVYFKKPGKMRWVYKKPANDELVSDGRKVWVWQQDLNQVIERSVDKAGPGIATDFLSGVGNLRRDFDIGLAGEGGGNPRLMLTPREPMPNVKKLTIELDKESLIVVKTIVSDLFGNETRVSFRNIKTNSPRKDSFFEFKVPEGATVVRP